MKIFLNYILFILLFSSSNKAYCQLVTYKFLDDEYNCSYQIKNGILNGEYVSYYRNGIKKSEGQFKNDYRIGNWTVWDSLGKIRMIRFYKSPFEFVRKFPSISNKGEIPLLLKSFNKIELNKDGSVKYSKMLAEDAIWRHKFWRTIYSKNNKEIFENNKLINNIINNIKNRNLTVYDTLNDRFTDTIPSNNLTYLNNNVISLERINLKEELVFDMNRLVSEYRIIGILPYIQINHTVKSIGWLYYPDLRKYLQQIPIVDNSLSKETKSFDDLFFYRIFCGSLTKTTIDNPYDLEIEKYPKTSKTLKYFQEYYMIRCIEDENDIWISLTK